jgi:hypothetical protein
MPDPLYDQPAPLIIRQLNSKHNLIETKKTLTRSTVYWAVSKESPGEKSLAKKAPAEKIPGVHVDVEVAHAQVSQCGDGEMREQEIKRLGAVIVVTQQDNNRVKIESVWRKLKREFPEQLQAANKVTIDDACAHQWMTFYNFQHCFHDAKNDLIKAGLVRVIPLMQKSLRSASVSQIRV